MKKYLMFFFALFMTGQLRAQINGLYSSEQIFNIIDEQRTSDDKQNLATKLTALGQFVGSGNSTLTLKASIFGINTAFSKEHATNPYYATHPFQRNFEIDLGATPNSSIFKYSNASAGFTYAIINNASMKKKDFEYLEESLNQNSGQYPRLQSLLTQIRRDHPEWHQKIDELLNDPKDAVLPAGLINILKAQGFDNAGKIFIDADSTFNHLKSHAQSRPLLTFAPNIDYDGQHGWVKDIIVKGSLTIYHLFNNDDSKIGYSLQPSYTQSDDTLVNNNKLSRKIYAVAASADIILHKGDDNKSDWEFKPTVSFAHTDGELYKGEKPDALSFISTISWKFSKDFTLPLSIKVTQNKPNFIGFLSIQYAL
jgi:hypothetical protein